MTGIQREGRALGGILLVCLLVVASPLGAQQRVAPAAAAMAKMDPAGARQWLAKWEKSITGDVRNRYCDREMGEEIGWLVSPFLNGFYYGYLATGDAKWIDLLVDWSDAVIKRGVKEPDGHLGWPKPNGTSTSAFGKDFYTDNQLGEAMALRPMVLMAGKILATPALMQKYGPKAQEYVALSEQVFKKWDSRGAWREVKAGGLWVVPPFGIDQQKSRWTEGYARRQVDGFSLPANKQNLVAMWLLAMSDVTKKPIYRQRAQKWFGVMKSRIRLTDGGRYCVWNYWDVGGPWDLKADGQPRHWVGVHPNGGYYGIDVEGIVAAFVHGLVFEKADIERLVATNLNMWNQQVQGASFRRIDGGEPRKPWQNSPGVLWSALAPYDATIRKIFEANFDPGSWGGLAGTPEYLVRFAELPVKAEKWKS